MRCVPQRAVRAGQGLPAVSRHRRPRDRRCLRRDVGTNIGSLSDERGRHRCRALPLWLDRAATKGQFALNR